MHLSSTATFQVTCLICNEKWVISTSQKAKSVPGLTRLFREFIHFNEKEDLWEN